MGQECRDDLVDCLWLKNCHEIAVSPQSDLRTYVKAPLGGRREHLLPKLLTGRAVGRSWLFCSVSISNECSHDVAAQFPKNKQWDRVRVEEGWRDRGGEREVT